MTRILIADDHAVVREGLKQLLSEKIGNFNFFCSTNIPETLEALRLGTFDLLLLDLFMPGGNCLTVLQEAKSRRPGLPILVLSSAPEKELAVRVLKAGANGYLDKQAAPDQLVEAVRKVVSGGTYVSAALGEQLATAATHHGLPLHQALSAREFQILHLVVEGHSLKEIASRLALSVKTVRTFHVRLLRKLRLQSDVDLVHYAQNHGLLEGRILP